jgi:hypothetical protein
MTNLAKFYFLGHLLIYSSYLLIKLMSIQTVRELYYKNYTWIVLVVIIATLFLLYSLLFIFYQESQDVIERRKGPSLKRRNAFKPGEIEKILKNIKRMKNLRIKPDE